MGLQPTTDPAPLLAFEVEDWPQHSQNLIKPYKAEEARRCIVVEVARFYMTRAHLVPVRHPSDGSRDSKDHGKHARRYTYSAQDNARIEINIWE